MNTLPEKVYTEDEKRKALQSAVYYFVNMHPFYGTMIQCLTTRYTTLLPTAAITYDPKQDQFEVLLNPSFFCKLDLKQRIAVLHHEVLHFTNKHLFRLPFISATPEDRMLYNIAGDMSINQYIQNLPNGCPQCPPRGTPAKCPNPDCVGRCIDVKDWKLKNGNPFPTLKSMEEYYELIKDNMDANKQMFQPNPNGNPDGDGPGTIAEGQVLDQHMWDQLDDEQKQQMLQEAKALVKRTMEKTVFGASSVPESVQDLLDEINALAAKLNYKAILKKAIKKSVSCADRDSTWKRPNKRYQAYAPGTKNGALPELSMYVDTSGSISTKELNEFLAIMSEFLKVGTRKCSLGLWHTDLYYQKKYKLHSKINHGEVQSGGTDVTPVLVDINKKMPDLSIILTDGYYFDTKVKPKGDIIWVISKGGNKNHPLKAVGKTILLDLLK